MIVEDKSEHEKNQDKIDISDKSSKSVSYINNSTIRNNTSLIIKEKSVFYNNFVHNNNSKVKQTNNYDVITNKKNITNMKNTTIENSMFYKPDLTFNKQEKYNLQYNNTINEILYGEDVYLNVYHVSKFNRALEYLGIGVYHSSIETYNFEFSYGENDILGLTGINRLHVDIEKPAIFHLKEKLLLGKTNFTFGDILSLTNHLGKHWNGQSYCPFTKNCNHFSEYFAGLILLYDNKYKISRSKNSLVDINNRINNKCMLGNNIYLNIKSRREENSLLETYPENNDINNPFYLPTYVNRFSKFSMCFKSFYKPIKKIINREKKKTKRLQDREDLFKTKISGNYDKLIKSHEKIELNDYDKEKSNLFLNHSREIKENEFSGINFNVKRFPNNDQKNIKFPETSKPNWNTKILKDVNNWTDQIDSKLILVDNNNDNEINQRNKKESSNSMKNKQMLFNWNIKDILNSRSHSNISKNDILHNDYDEFEDKNKNEAVETNKNGDKPDKDIMDSLIKTEIIEKDNYNNKTYCNEINTHPINDNVKVDFSNDTKFHSESSLNSIKEYIVQEVNNINNQFNIDNLDKVKYSLIENFLRTYSNKELYQKQNIISEIVRILNSTIIKLLQLIRNIIDFIESKILKSTNNDNIEFNLINCVNRKSTYKNYNNKDIKMSSIILKRNVNKSKTLTDYNLNSGLIDREAIINDLIFISSKIKLLIEILKQFKQHLNNLCKHENYFDKNNKEIKGVIDYEKIDLSSYIKNYFYILNESFEYIRNKNACNPFIMEFYKDILLQMKTSIKTFHDYCYNLPLKVNDLLNTQYFITEIEKL